MDWLLKYMPKVMMLMQKKMKLLGNDITYDAYTASTLTADDNMHGRIEDIKDQISSNFLKVKHQITNENGDKTHSG